MAPLGVWSEIVDAALLEFDFPSLHFFFFFFHASPQLSEFFFFVSIGESPAAEKIALFPLYLLPFWCLRSVATP